MPPASEPLNIVALALSAEYAYRAAVRTRDTAPQRILGEMSQLANGRIKPLAEPDIELNGSKYVGVGIYELPAWRSKFSFARPYAPNRFRSAWKPNSVEI